MEPPFLVSLCYYAYVVLLCEIGRSLCRAFVRDKPTLSLLEELIGTTQMCASLFENGFIFTRYGYLGFALVLFLLFIAHSLTLRNAYSNPCPLFEEIFNGKLSSMEFASKLLCQLSGAVLSFRVANLFWLLGMIDDHRLAYTNFQCSSDLHVSIFAGINFEMGAAFLYRFLSLKFQRHFPRHDMWLDAILVVCLVLAGLPFTGMYFNPILAMSNNYGCRNVVAFEHFFVYWLGPIIGWQIGTRLHRLT